MRMFHQNEKGFTRMRRFHQQSEGLLEQRKAKNLVCLTGSVPLFVFLVYTCSEQYIPSCVVGLQCILCALLFSVLVIW